MTTTPELRKELPELVAVYPSGVSELRLFPLHRTRPLAGMAQLHQVADPHAPKIERLRALGGGDRVHEGVVDEYRLRSQSDGTDLRSPATSQISLARRSCTGRVQIGARAKRASQPYVSIS